MQLPISDARPRSLKTSIGLAAVLVGVGLAAPAAQARRPSLVWTLPSAANARSPVSFSWTAEHLNRRGRAGRAIRRAAWA